MSLDSAVQHLLAAKRISAASQSYAKDNPGEWAKVKAYLEGGARPTGVTTEMGLGLIEVEDERRGVTPPPPPPPPPPGSEVPWSGYVYAAGLDNQVQLPNRHFAYQPDGSLSLSCYPDSPVLGAGGSTPRFLTSAYKSAGAQAAEGRRVRYETRITFPSDFKGTTGEVNWWFEWHEMVGQPASCAIGGRCDYPVDFTKPGENLTWYFRPYGPNGKVSDPSYIGPPVQVGRSYDVKVEILWSSTAGEFKAFLDGQMVKDFRVPTLFPGDNPLLGVYNYRLAAPFASTLTFTKPVVTVL